MTLDTEYFKSNTQLLHDRIIKKLELHIMDKDLKDFHNKYTEQNKDESISFDLWFFSEVAASEANSILDESKKDYISK